MIMQFLQALKGFIELTIKRIKINMFNRTVHITNNNFFGEMTIDEMVQTIKGLSGGAYDKIVIKYHSEATQDKRPAAKAKETEESK